MPQLTELRDRIDEMVDEILEGSEFFRVECCVSGSTRAPIISVYLDGDQGIGIRECARVSRNLHGKIEEEGACPNGFELNVSSPGPSRSLRLARQYARHVGRVVRLRIEDGDAHESVEGRLLAATEDVVRIERDSGEAAFPFSSVREAVVKTAW